MGGKKLEYVFSSLGVFMILSVIHFVLEEY